MTRNDKLDAKLIANPRTPIAFRDFEKLLRTFGFEHDRTKASHQIWVHTERQLVMNVQKSGKEGKPYQVKQLPELIEQHGQYMQS